MLRYCTDVNLLQLSRKFWNAGSSSHGPLAYIVKLFIAEKLKDKLKSAADYLLFCQYQLARTFLTQRRRSGKRLK